MKYYVVSDVHGYLDYLKKALDDAGFFDEKQPCKLIVCGDMLDRGDQAVELVDFMLSLMKEDKLIYVLGNHEELFVDCLQEIAAGEIYKVSSHTSHHYRNMTWHSILQIGGMSSTEAYALTNTLVRRVMQSPFYKKLLTICIDYYETKNYVFTHGYIPCISEGSGYYASYKYDPDWRDADVYAWHRARWYNGMDFSCNKGIKESGKTIVCGHYRASYGHAKIEKKGSDYGDDADFSPFYADGIIAIDACAAASGKINCIVIEDEEL